MSVIIVPGTVTDRCIEYFGADAIPYKLEDELEGLLYDLSKRVVSEECLEIFQTEIASAMARVYIAMGAMSHGLGITDKMIQDKLTEHGKPLLDVEGHATRRPTRSIGAFDRRIQEDRFFCEACGAPIPDVVMTNAKKGPIRIPTFSPGSCPRCKTNFRTAITYDADMRAKRNWQLSDQ